MQLLLRPEHAPLQVASRPCDTVSVTGAPILKGTDAVLPTATLMPAGFDVTVSPLRPVAVTVRVAVCGGVTVRTAVFVTPPAEAVNVTGVDVVTEFVPMANPALALPWATVILLFPGPAATVPSPEVTDTGNPPAGAGLLIVTVPID